MDEISCNVRDWDYFMTVVFGPWLGATIFLILMFCLILWYRSSKERVPLDTQRNLNQEINSYAESYELSSNLSSAHHMAIQVRVVCNSNHPHHGSRNGTHQPWKNDLPPTYESLFPQGPPENYSPITSITATVSQGASVSAVNAVGINVSSTMSLPSTVATTSGMRINEGSSAVENSRAVTDITSIIDLNIRSNHLETNHGTHLQTNNGTESSQVSESSSNAENMTIRSSTSNIQSSAIGLNVGSDETQQAVIKNDESNISSISNQPDSSSASQTNVTFITVTPNRSSTNEQCVATQTDQNSPKLDISLDSPAENSSSSIAVSLEDGAQKII
ncbi:hypothetical protein Avbf_04751 [Armadillidium vulgare]|nr:hypothetical protein Avbf_04751 [Armadillidium vulgare]